jgi:hypothetical protein
MPRLPTVAIPFPLSSSPGERAHEGGGRLINCFAEPLGESGPAKQKWTRSPGMSVFATQAVTGFRGAILVNNLIYAAFANIVKTIDSSGVVTSVAALSGTKPVTWARNNAANPDIQCVDPDNGAFAVTSSSVASFSGGGALPAPNCVCAQDGYFFWGVGDNSIFAAGPNTTTLNSQTFTTVQSRPTGGLLRLIPYKGLLLAFCTKFTEIYSNTANPFPSFPYSRLSVFDRGLIGANAIAGHEDGFGKLGWVSDDFGVYRLNASFEPEKISPPDLDRAIRAVADKSTIRCGCFVHDGRSFFTVSAPGWTWQFNWNTEKWNERMSFDSGLLTVWRGIGGIGAFDKWILGDAQTGNLLRIDPTVFTEASARMLWRMESGPVLEFPSGQRVARADFEFVPGVGVATGADNTIIAPRVAISWTRPDGVNFGNPLLREIGQQGNGRRRVYVTNTGIAGPNGRRWRLDITDPVYVSFLAGRQSADIRAT